MSSSIDNLAGSLAGAGIGAYLFAVVWNGNIQELGSMLMQEQGYIEFVAALLLLGLVHKYGPSGRVTSALTTMAIIAVMVRLGTNTNLNQTLAKFASGQASALETLKALFEGR